MDQEHRARTQATPLYGRAPTGATRPANATLIAGRSEPATIPGPHRLTTPATPSAPQLPSGPPPHIARSMLWPSDRFPVRVPQGPEAHTTVACTDGDRRERTSASAPSDGQFPGVSPEEDASVSVESGTRDAREPRSSLPKGRRRLWQRRPRAPARGVSRRTGWRGRRCRLPTRSLSRRTRGQARPCEEHPRPQLRDRRPPASSGAGDEVQLATRSEIAHGGQGRSESPVPRSIADL